MLKGIGEGVQEKVVNFKIGEVLVNINPRYFRPTEVDLYNAEKKLGLKIKVDFNELFCMMVEEDLKCICWMTLNEYMKVAKSI